MNAVILGGFSERGWYRHGRDDPLVVALLLFNNLIKSHSKYTKRITANKSGS